MRLPSLDRRQTSFGLTYTPPHKYKQQQQVRIQRHEGIIWYTAVRSHSATSVTVSRVKRLKPWQQRTSVWKATTLRTIDTTAVPSLSRAQQHKGRRGTAAHVSIAQQKSVILKRSPLSPCLLSSLVSLFSLFCWWVGGWMGGCHTKPLPRLPLVLTLPLEPPSHSGFTSSTITWTTTSINKGLILSVKL